MSFTADDRADSLGMFLTPAQILLMLMWLHVLPRIDPPDELAKLEL